MTIEIALLLLESVLLVVTIILILYSIRESARRRDLLIGVGKATKILTRIEYFSAVSDSMMEAQEEIIGYVTGRRAYGDDERKVTAILDAIKRATSRGVRVKYILPKFHDRLYMGYLYSSAGAEVKYRGGSLVHSLRYMVVNGGLVVVGIPEGTGRREMTSKGHWLPSRALAGILKNHFHPRWQKSATFGEFVDEVLKQTGVSLNQLALELGIEAKKLEMILTEPLPQSHGRQDKSN